MNDWPTNSELLVMRILQGSASGLYGLQIVEQSEGEVKRGSIYVLLGRLEEKGYVDVTRPKDNGELPGMPRPRYKLNAEGARTLSFIESRERARLGVCNG